MTVCITNEYFVGTTPTYTALTTDSNGDAANADTVTFTHVDAAGTSINYVSGTDSEVTNPTTGTYVFAVPALAAPVRGQDVGRVVVTVVMTSETEIERSYYRVVTP